MGIKKSRRIDDYQSNMAHRTVSKAERKLMEIYTASQVVRVMNKPFVTTWINLLGKVS